MIQPKRKRRPSPSVRNTRPTAGNAPMPLWRLLSGLVEVASRPCTAAGYPPLPHQEAQP